MFYICGCDAGLPGSALSKHLEHYLRRGCGPSRPPARACMGAELEAMLAGDLQIGTFLWFITAIYLCSPQSLNKAAALQRLGAAVAAADGDDLDRQICQLQGGGDGGPPLLTSQQLQYLCYSFALAAATATEWEMLRMGLPTSLADAACVQYSDRMLELEPTNPLALVSAATHSLIANPLPAAWAWGALKPPPRSSSEPWRRRGASATIFRQSSSAASQSP